MGYNAGGGLNNGDYKKNNKNKAKQNKQYGQVIGQCPHGSVCLVLSTRYFSGRPVHSNQDQIRLVKLGEYIVFYVDRRS